MPVSARYFDLVREMKNAYNHRLRLVESARQRGLKPTARLFGTTVRTVRKWLRRFQQHGPSGLHEQSRARHHQAHKTPATREAQLVQLRKTLPTFGARRLIREFDLRIGHNALERIWHVHGLIAKRRRKYQRKQDLARIKAQWALFQQISADTKDLDDIPRYWQQAQRLRLPLVQYTAREIRSGLLFWAFAEGRSASASALFAVRIQQHLARYGVSLRDLVWQTDNGGEFKGAFPQALGASQHVRIPPPRTPIKATWKPCTVWKRTSSSISKTSLAAATSSPKCTPTSCTSTWCAPIRTKKIKAPGKSSSASRPACLCNFDCSHPSFWTTTSPTPGDTMCQGIPRTICS